eukprot:836604_1
MTIHYDGWSEQYDKSIVISSSISVSKNLKKFHTITPYHNYLYDDSVQPCDQHSNDDWIECYCCQKRCCVCFIDQWSSLCKECMQNMNYGTVFEALVTSTDSNVDMNIFYCIIEYIGIVVECVNNECSEIRVFDSMIQLRDCSLSKYKRTVNRIAPGTIKIYGEYRRVFCYRCTD